MAETTNDTTNPNVNRTVSDRIEGVNKKLRKNKRRRQRANVNLNRANRQSKRIGKQLQRSQRRLGEYGEQIAEFANYEDTVRLFGDVAEASYLQNQDIIQQRSAMREALYGERGMQPGSYNLLTANQQQNIRTANQPGLIAGIQALNETEQARGARVEDLMEESRQTFQAKQEALQGAANIETQRANILSQRANVLESRKSNILSRLQVYNQNRDTLRTRRDALRDQGRQFALGAIQAYPGLLAQLDQGEINKINNGNVDDAIMAKIQAFVASENEYTADQRKIENIQQVEFTDSGGNSYVIGLDKATGKELYRRHLGNVGVKGGGGGGSRSSGKGPDDAFRSDAADMIQALGSGKTDWGTAWDTMKALYPEKSNQEIDSILGGGQNPETGEYYGRAAQQTQSEDSVGAASAELQGYIDSGSVTFESVMQDPEVPDSVKAGLKSPY